MSAPELEELIENETKQFIKLKVKGKNVRYELDGTKTYDRYVGLSFFGGKDIGIFIIVSGLALNYPCYSKERSLAILDALGCDDMSTAKLLLSSAPMKTYSQRDLAITGFVDVIELISLNFDRGYYSMIAALFEIERAILSENDRSKSGKLLAEQHRMEHELRGFIEGLQLFSDRIEISIDRLLAFSIANDQKFLNRRLQKRDPLTDEDAIQAETICSMIEGLWKRRAPHTVFQTDYNA